MMTNVFDKYLIFLIVFSIMSCLAIIHDIYSGLGLISLSLYLLHKEATEADH